MSATVASLPQAEIEYPDSDGEPMADNSLQWEWMVRIKSGLDSVFKRDPEVLVAGDMLWYPVEGKPNIRMAPDVFAVFGRPKGHRGSYRQWVEAGIAPQVVFEVLSPGNRAGPMREKFEFYDRYQVEEYYVYDPDSNDLRGWLRRDGELQEIANMRNWVSPRLGVRFEWTDEGLELIGPDGERFVNYADVVEEKKTVTEERDKLAEQNSAITEERDRLQREADARAEENRRLKERLRELGFDTET